MSEEPNEMERERAEAQEFNKIIGLAIGYQQRPDGQWLNSYGAPISSLPDFSGSEDYSKVVIRFFESLDSKVKGYNKRFFDQYREGMNPKQICELAASVLAVKE